MTFVWVEIEYNLFQLIEELDENILQVQDELHEVPWSDEDEEKESAGGKRGKGRGEEDADEEEMFTVEPSGEENKEIEERNNRKNTINDFKTKIQSYVEVG